MIQKQLVGMPGIRLNGHVINNIRYVHDTVLMAETNEDLQALLDKVVASSSNYGLTINASKTFCMVISESDPRCKLKAEGKEIQQVNHFNYLGSYITNDSR